MLQYSVYCYVRYTAEVSVSYEMPIQWEQFTLEIHVHTASVTLYSLQYS